MSAVVRGLDHNARQELKWSDITQAEYRRHHFGPDAQRWYGDTCGCPDDRCKDGYHHEPDEDCGCLAVTLDAYARERR